MCSCNVTHSAILLLLKVTYSFFEMAPFLYAVRFVFTSVVWGKDPIVVVGNKGRLNAFF